MDSGNPGPSRRSVLIGGSVGLIGAGLALSGCSSSGGQTKSVSRKYSGGPVKTGTPKAGGTLRVGMFGNSASDTLNPLAAIGLADLVRLYNLYEPLFSAGPNGTLTPKLAVSASPNATATLWTFHLRRGVQWHNGKTFTADDVVFTVKSSWGNPKNLFNAALASIVDFANVKKIDPYTVSIPLKLPVADFPSVTAFPNLYVVQNGTTNFNNGVGTGPFSLKSFKPGSSTFEANRNHWHNGGPHVSSLVIDSSFTSEQSRINALLAKDLDVVPQTVPALAAANASSGRLVLGNQPGPSCVPMIMRVDQGALKDPKIREALKLIPNRDQFVSNVFSGYGTVSNDSIGYGDKYWASDLKQEQDLDKAKSLLKSAGASKFSVTLKTSTVVAGMNEIATLFKRQAAAAGVTINLKQYSPTAYYTPQAGVFTRDFCLDFASQGLNSLAIFYLTWMLPKAPYNQSHFGNAAADRKLVLDALGETDEGKAKDKWHTVQEQQVKDGPYIVPATQNWLDAYGTNVRGVQTTTAYTCNGYDFASAWLA
jgi:peptide/nickel transport system substrate-binding protein